MLLLEPNKQAKWILGFILTSATFQSSFAAKQLSVYAAASLTEVMTHLSHTYEKNHNITIKSSYAGSSTLAKQIEAGALPDIFISADRQWMDYLKKRNLIQENSTVNLLSTSLVLIAPKNSTIRTINFAAPTPPVFQGKICTGDPASVPIGKYAKQSLQSLGWWTVLEKRIVATDDVRTALNFVARGECPLGIVYATDAMITSDVKIIGTFPENTHQPVIYPMALTKNAKATAASFYQFLQSSEAKKVYMQYGFKPIFK